MKGLHPRAESEVFSRPFAFFVPKRYIARLNILRSLPAQVHRILKGRKREAVDP